MAILDLSFGPILLGTFLNVLLYGILIIQIFLYFVVHKQDKTWIKLMVGWLLLLDTLNTVFNMGLVYRYLITLFGDFPALIHSHWLLHIEPLMTVTIASTMQLFFAWRIGKLTGQAWIGWCIAAASTVQFFAGLGTTIGAWIVVDFNRFGELKVPIILWLAMSAATDVAITSVLTWYLHTHRTGFPQTNDLISRIIRLTVQTGLLTTLWAVTDLILFLALPNSLHFLFNLPLCKLYSNSLMSTLNSRGGWGSDISGNGSGSTEGVSIHVSAIRRFDLSEGGRDVRNERLSNFQQQTGIHAPKQEDHGFELDEYTNSKKIDIEEAGETYSHGPGHISDTSLVRDDDGHNAKQVNVLQLPLGEDTTNASQEWSLRSASVRVPSLDDRT